MAELSTDNQTTVSEKNSCGVFGLILSIIGICLCGFWLFSVPGLILSLIGLRKEPRKAATAGAIIGGIGTIAFLIIGPLVLGIMLPAFATASTRAREIMVNAQIHGIHVGSDAYYGDHQSYPTSFAELEDGSYITNELTIDPWDNQLQFEGGGKTKPVITSAGPDGEFNTDDDVQQKDGTE